MSVRTNNYPKLEELRYFDKDVLIELETFYFENAQHIKEFIFKSPNYKKFQIPKSFFRKVNKNNMPKSIGIKAIYITFLIKSNYLNLLETFNLPKGSFMRKKFRYMLIKKIGENLSLVSVNFHKRLHNRKFLNSFIFLYKEKMTKKYSLSVFSKAESLILANTDKYLEDFNTFEKETINQIQIDISYAHQELESLKEDQVTLIKNIANVSSVEKFYLLARTIDRHFTLHLGPTNSGKTYTAVQALKKAKTGVYLAPLRLLAREIYEELLYSGIRVSLVTGEEKIIDPEATHICSTIEMLDIDRRYDIAIIDEIQMIGDSDRGNAWTRSVLGVAADHIYLLGSDSAEELSLNLIKRCRNTYEVKHFQRLSPLVDKGFIYDFTSIEKGDAIIAFSRREVHEIAEILKEQKLSVGVIYGNLPPSLRIDVAEKFNQGEFDVIVSTDAIGMGLNLNIKRIIFSAMYKFTKQGRSSLPLSLYKQIAGRAGRYKKENFGEYLFLNYKQQNKKEAQIFNNLSQKINKPCESIKECLFFPEYTHVKELAENLNRKDSLEYLLNEFKKYFLDANKHLNVSYTGVDHSLSLLEKFGKKLDIETKYKLVFAPVNRDNSQLFISFIKYLSSNSIEEFECDVLTWQYKKGIDSKNIEMKLNQLSLYMWLAYRHPELDKIDDATKKYEYLSEELSSLIIESAIIKRKRTLDVS